MAFATALIAVTLAVPCNAATTKNVVHRFVVDFNAGRGAAAGRLFAPAPEFQWLSAGPPGRRIGSRARDRSTVDSWIRSRARAHDRIAIRRLGAGYDRTRDIVNFGGTIVRSGRVKDFKGAATCAFGRPLLIVWSM